MFRTLLTVTFVLMGISWSAGAFAEDKRDLVLEVAAKRSDCTQQEFLYICGTRAQRTRVLKLIDKVQNYPIGVETWDAIKNSGHRLMVAHWKEILAYGGETQSLNAEDLVNGVGSSAVIYLNLNVPNGGSHVVGGTVKQYAPFTFEQNFFHELSHARHAMEGTWDVSNAEGQAITDENVYRQQSNPSDPNLRSMVYGSGYQIWFQ